MRRLLFAIPLTMLPDHAVAQDYILVRWTTNARCEIVTQEPTFGAFWEELGTYPTLREARRALAAQTVRRVCIDQERPKGAEEKAKD